MATRNIHLALVVLFVLFYNCRHCHARPLKRTMRSTQTLNEILLSTVVTVACQNSSSTSGLCSEASSATSDDLFLLAALNVTCKLQRQLKQIRKVSATNSTGQLYDSTEATKIFVAVNLRTAEDWVSSMACIIL